MGLVVPVLPRSLCVYIWVNSSAAWNRARHILHKISKSPSKSRNQGEKMGLIHVNPRQWCVNHSPRDLKCQKWLLVPLKIGGRKQLMWLGGIVIPGRFPPGTLRWMNRNRTSRSAFVTWKLDAHGDTHIKAIRWTQHEHWTWNINHRMRRTFSHAY